MTRTIKCFDCNLKHLYEEKASLFVHIGLRKYVLRFVFKLKQLCVVHLFLKVLNFFEFTDDRKLFEVGGIIESNFSK